VWWYVEKIPNVPPKMNTKINTKVYKIKKNMKSKYKITNKKGRRLLIINSEKGQTLNKREVEELQNGTMRGTLPIEVTFKRNGFAITYDLTSYIPLEQYVRTIVNKKKFVEIMLQILEIFQALTDQFYSTQNLVMDLEKVVVSPSTNKIYFPFVPILYYDYGVTVKEFLIQLIYSTTFDNTEDTAYIDQCLYILQKNMNFSRVELEEYLKTQTDGEEAKKKKVTTNGIQEIYNPFEQWNSHKKEIKDDANESVGQAIYRETEEEERGITHSSRMTESLSDIGEGGTVLLGATEKSYVKQVRTGQKYYLKSNETTVGKRQCSILIADNPAVSREHAKLVRVHEDYFVVDLNATNGTKVNGRKIQPSEQVMLKDEDLLEFANEKFIFYK